jgi:hypothetical protein
MTLEGATPGGDQHGDLPRGTLRGLRGGVLVSLRGKVGNGKIDQVLVLIPRRRIEYVE